MQSSEEGGAFEREGLGLGFPSADPGMHVMVQEADAVVASIEKLGQILGVEPQVAQSLVTTDPRYEHKSHPPHHHQHFWYWLSAGECTIRLSNTIALRLIHWRSHLIPRLMATGDLCRFVDAEAVEEVLEEMSRLMPKQDPKMVLLRDPSWLLRVERGTKRLGPHPDDICMPHAPTLRPLSQQAMGDGTLPTTYHTTLT